MGIVLPILFMKVSDITDMNNGSQLLDNLIVLSDYFSDFVIKIPEGMDLEKTAPILCAGKF